MQKGRGVCKEKLAARERGMQRGGRGDHTKGAAAAERTRGGIKGEAELSTRHLQRGQAGADAVPADREQ